MSNPEKYGFEPRRLLGQIADIYLHLDCKEFAAALAGDERSFSRELLEEAAGRMERAEIKTPIELEQLRSLAKRAGLILQQNLTREVDFGDAPDEFRGRFFIVRAEGHPPKLSTLNKGVYFKYKNNKVIPLCFFTTQTVP